MRPVWMTLLGYILAIIVFLALSGYALLYAMGYKIDWGNLTLKKTGFILMESYPRGASIKLADKDLNVTTPATIKRLLPDQYPIELTRENYRLWQGDVKVESGLVTEKRNILLTANDLQITPLLEENVIAMTGAPNNKVVALLINKEIWLWQVAEKTKSAGVTAALIRQHIKDPSTSDIANGQLSPISFSPDSESLLFQSTGRLNQYYLVINIKNGVIKLIASGRNFTNWRWLSNTELVALTNNKFNLFNLSNVKPIVINDVISYGIFDNSPYLAHKSKEGKIVLVRANRSGVLEEEIAELPSGNLYSFGKIKNNWLCVAANATTTTIWLSAKTNGNLTWQKLADKVTAPVLWDDAYLIYRQGNQILGQSWEKLEEPPAILLNSWTAKLVHFSYDTILYLEGQKLKSVDLTGKNIYELLDLASFADMIITETQMSKIIFLDAKTHWLTAATLREITPLFLPL